MSDRVGIFRNENDLRAAVEEIRRIRGEAAELCVCGASPACNQELIDVLDLTGMIDLGEIIAAGALRRTESRGSHARTDFPRRDDARWLRHTVAHRGPDGPLLTEKAVTITDYEPRERTY